ncbi:protein of unknown function [Shewanella benthica]|uniref:Uncharacterized protein n=1 Tax=Shewanella benthica TaxID=43661 RepID=A0A330M7C3_9GAMM|nr:protein of unknown function [Shewanella benthica]
MIAQREFSASEAMSEAHSYSTF